MDGLLNYDNLLPSADAPPFLEAGDDLGSYEVKSKGEVDRNKYQRERDFVEDHLDGKIGHQHFVHAWPSRKAEREFIAPHYIELLDATTWLLFWRQLDRNPNEVDSILSHPFLGLYPRASLERLFDAMVAGDASRFRNKNRMVGARSLAAKPELRGQKGRDFLPDFEMRSGNKGIKRDFVEDLIEARISSGDYSGLRDFRSYDFDPSANMEILASPWLSAGEIEKLKLFETQFPLMKYSNHALAMNHTRNKIIAPLLPWRNRIPLEYKAELLQRAQARYAEGLVGIANFYLRRIKTAENSSQVGSLREETLDKLEHLAYLFARRVKLDEDLEKYLTPRPDKGGPFYPGAQFGKNRHQSHRSRNRI